MATHKQKLLITKTEGETKGVEAFLSLVEGLKSGRWQIDIYRYHKTRSNRQNAYYHSCVLPFVKDGLIDMGFEAHLLNHESVHELLKGKFLKIDAGIDSGEFITLTRSTKDLSTVEFMDYIAEIQKWASEFLAIVIPDPNEQAEIGFK